MREIVSFIFFRPGLQAPKVFLNHDPKFHPIPGRLHMLNSNPVGIRPFHRPRSGKRNQKFSVGVTGERYGCTWGDLHRISKSICRRCRELHRLVHCTFADQSRNFSLRQPQPDRIPSNAKFHSFILRDHYATLPTKISWVRAFARTQPELTYAVCSARSGAPTSMRTNPIGRISTTTLRAR
jgi:hypothetical protein